MKKQMQRMMTLMLTAVLIFSSVDLSVAASEENPEENVTVVSEVENEEIAEEETEVKTEFFYSDDRIEITAIAKEEANLPANAELKADYIAEGTEEYNEAVETVEAQMSEEGKEFAGFVCYDVCFEADGVEIEPEAGKVQVTMKYKQPQFEEVVEEADELEYATYHIIDETNVVEEVTEVVKTNDDGAVTSVAFCTESFSKFISAVMTAPQTADDGKLLYGDYNLGNYSTNIFRATYKYEDNNGNKHTIEDAIAYCLQADLGTPVASVDGGGDLSYIIQCSNLKKILYYGYSGEGDVSETFFNSHTLLIKSLGESVYQKLSNSKTERNNFFYILTHVAASYEYYRFLNDSNAESKAYSGVNTDGKNVINVWYQYLLKCGTIDEGLTLLKNGIEVTSIEDDLGSEAKYELTGNGSLTLTIPRGVICTVSKDGQSNSYTNQKVTIYAGSKFVFSTASLYSTEENNIAVAYAGEAEDATLEEMEVAVVKYDPDKHGWEEKGQDVGLLINMLSTIQYNLSWEKAAFEITKTDDKNNTLSGVQFEVYDNEACEGNPLTTVTTGSDGKAYLEMTITSTLTDNKVYLKEITPDNYFDSDVISATLTPTGEGENVVVTNISVVNETFVANLEIVKADANDQTKKLPGAEFAIYEENDLINAIAVGATDKNGKLAVKNLETGTYVIKETKAPYGYYLDSDQEPITVKIGKNEEENRIDFENEKIPVYSVEIKNNVVTGTLTIQKIGETLSDVTGEEGNKTFTYDATVNLEGAVFELYKKDDPSKIVVATLVTDSDGKATVSGLELGSYVLQEVEAPRGYVLDSKTYEVTIEYKDQSTKVVSAALTGEEAIGNKHQKLEVSIIKKSSSDETVLKGAELKLYAAEDIMIGDNTVLEKDGLIETQITDEEGRATFKADIPFGKYYVVESKAPMGYEVSSEKVEFDLNDEYDSNYVGEAIVKYEKTLNDEEITLLVNKTDLYATKMISGATIVLKAKDNIYDAEGTLVYPKGFVVDSWVSEGGESKDFGAKMICGYTYELCETKAPRGYVYAENIVFKLLDDGTVEILSKSSSGKVVNSEGVILMRDEAIHFYLKKVEAGTMKELEGAEFTLYTKDGNGDYTKVVASCVSEEGKLIDFGKYLKAGRAYLVKETKLPEGYYGPVTIEFKVEKDGTIVTDAESIVDEKSRTIYLAENKVIEEWMILGSQSNGQNVVNTGDPSQIMLYAGMSLATVLGMISVRKKFAEKNEK